MINSQFKPFESKNIIFFDTEFTSLNPYEGELLSFGAVKKNGEEFYVEIEHGGSISPYVSENILPLLKEEKKSREEASREICKFIGESKPWAVAFVDNYDKIYTDKMIGFEKLPFNWMTIDFSTILFMLGENPLNFLPEQTGADAFYEKIGVDYKKYRQHHALDDALLLRDVWNEIIGK